MRAKAVMYMLMVLLVSGIAFALPSITLASPNSGKVVSSQNVEFKFSVSDYTGVEECSLIINNVVNKTMSPITLNQNISVFSALGEGIYIWRISCRNDNSEEGFSSVYDVEVDITSPTITVNSPSNGEFLNLSSFAIQYTPYDINLDNCSLWSNFFGSWQMDQADTSVVSGAANSFNVAVTSGSYYWAVKCYDEGGLFVWSPHYTLTVDITPPSISSTSPSSVVTSSSATLSVTTNENAFCRYSNVSGRQFSNMSGFSSTGGKTHTKVISGLNEGTYSYFVKCKDTVGNLMDSEHEIMFEVSLSPTAEISLSDESPVKAGTIEVELETSRPMITTPTLSYSFDDSSTKKEIPLTGSGTEWEGYFVIEDSDEKKVGAFHFSGTDIDGNTGNFITDGRLFIVDTIEPEPPKDFEAKAQKNGNIILEWFYDEDEDVDYFEIYRSTEPGLSYLDFYHETKNTQYIDTSTVDKVTYYYAIAVVDEAGNRGKFSREAYATSIPSGASSTIQETKQEETPKVLPPDLVPKVDDMIKRVDSMLIDVKEAKSGLSSATDEKKELITELKLLEEVDNVNLRLNNMKKELADLKNTYRTESELDSELSKVDLEIKKFEKTIPKEVNLIEKTEFVQSVSSDNIRQAVDELALVVDLSEDDKSEYIKESKKYEDEINIETRIYVMSIEYLDQAKSDKTLIRKKFSHGNQEPFNDVVVIETIPKEVVESTDEIEFITPNYEIIRKDPVVKWGFYEFSYEGKSISYIIEKGVDVETAKQAKSVVILGIGGTSDSNPVTGYSIFSFTTGLSTFQSIFMWLGIILIVGLLTYYFVFVKSDSEIFASLANRFRRRKDFDGGRASLRSHEKDLSGITSGKRFYNEGSKSQLSELQYQINSMKLDMADKLYPIVSSLQKAIESKEDNEIKGKESFLKIRDLIQEANRCLESREYNRAAIIYPEIRLLYKELPGSLKAEVHDQCVELFSRINTAGIG